MSTEMRGSMKLPVYPKRWSCVPINFKTMHQGLQQRAAQRAARAKNGKRLKEAEMHTRIDMPTGASSNM